MSARYQEGSARMAVATAPCRDRTVDALRAVAIAGVVLGHWLVTAVVADPDRPAALHGASPLSTLPVLAPVSWLFQTLGPFFVAAGYAAARRRPRTGPRRRGTTLGRNVTRWGLPVLVLGAVWLPALAVLDLVGAPASTRRVVVSLVTHPLWFLAVYLVLTGFAPLLRRFVRRCGLWSVLPAVLTVAAVDASRVDGLPGWVAPLATPVAWSVPYLLGIALAEGRLSRRSGGVVLGLGLAGGALLLRLGYPASAVGVPGDRWSNLDPPSLLALALVAAQLGVFLLVRPWLAALLAAPARWAPVAALNRAAMTVYCAHQSALLLVTFASVPVGVLPGLLDRPTGSWVLYRLLWLPVFALALLGLARLFHRPPGPSDVDGRALVPVDGHATDTAVAGPPPARAVPAVRGAGAEQPGQYGGGRHPAQHDDVAAWHEHTPITPRYDADERPRHPPRTPRRPPSTSSSAGWPSTRTAANSPSTCTTTPVQPSGNAPWHRTTAEPAHLVGWGVVRRTGRSRLPAAPGRGAVRPGRAAG